MPGPPFSFALSIFLRAQLCNRFQRCQGLRRDQLLLDQRYPRPLGRLELAGRFNGAARASVGIVGVYHFLASLITSSRYSPEDSVKSIIAGSIIAIQSARSMGDVSLGAGRAPSCPCRPSLAITSIILSCSLEAEVVAPFMGFGCAAPPFSPSDDGTPALFELLRRGQFIETSSLHVYPHSPFTLSEIQLTLPL